MHLFTKEVTDAKDLGYKWCRVEKSLDVQLSPDQLLASDKQGCINTLASSPLGM